MAVESEMERKCVNTIRSLAMDAVEAAGSGHPGTPMAMAPVGYCLWNEALSFDPEAPTWPNRDRFVLSMGHASMLLYALLHLSGVKQVGNDYEMLESLAVELEDIQRFRQWGSKCPGHPEYRHTSGVEITTGPLGQGVAASVGMAIASRWQGAHFNRPGFKLFDFDVYALAGDGCLMEGASSEAASLAGHLKLAGLCWIYDNNKITIEGETDLAFSEDVETRFIAMGWVVARVSDANDLKQLRRAFQAFRSETERPTLIIVNSQIGFGAPTKAGSHEAHGAPLGLEEVRGAKLNLGWESDLPFHVPEGVREHFSDNMKARGGSERHAWDKKLEAYQREYPELAEQLRLMQRRELPTDWDTTLPTFMPEDGAVAGRDASGKALNALAEQVPWLLGGSADLAPSTKTRLEFAGAGDFSAQNHGGRNFHFGVRELAMGSVLNGLAACKLRAYGSGFFVFSDFSRPAIRLAALMALPVVYVFTHDSIGVGEDGPTHQPVEQLATLRAMPGLLVLRPGDANEVSECYRVIAGERRRPICLVLSRQKLPTLDRKRFAPAQGVKRGAYVLADSSQSCRGQAGKIPVLILMASGSEVELAVEAFETLSAEGVSVRLVNFVSWELFEEQSAQYREEVLPREVRLRVAVEAGVSLGWERYVGDSGEVVGMKSFGASAPLPVLQQKFALTADEVLLRCRRVLGRYVELSAE